VAFRADEFHKPEVVVAVVFVCRFELARPLEPDGEEHSINKSFGLTFG